MHKTLLAVAAGLVVGGLGMWWLHRRRSGRHAAAAPGRVDENCHC